MAAWKRSGRVARTLHRLPQLPVTLWLALAWGASAIYAFLFFRLPIAETVTVDGQAISRAAFVLGSLLYPEGLVQTWFDGGRLPSGFLDRLPIASGTALWLGQAAAIGLPLVDRAVGKSQGWAMQLERWSLAALAGLALLSTLTLLVGLAGGLRSRVPLLLAIGGLAAVVYGAGRLLRRAPEETRSEFASRTSTQAREAKSQIRGLLDRACAVVTIALVCWSAALTMFGAWVPPSEFDVLEYHLQAPKEFFQAGSVHFLPHNVYANMPLGAEMHTLAMMTLVGQPDAWLGGMIGKSITAAFSILGAMLLGGILARRFGSLCGWWAAGLWLTTPGIAHVAMLGLIDGALATYVAAAAICVGRAIETLRWQRERQSQTDALTDEHDGLSAVPWWGLAGLMAGAAAATKYPGLIFAGAPALVALVLTVWVGWLPGKPLPPKTIHLSSRRGAWIASALMALGMLATCGPWYAKNWSQAGNPVYPLAANIFGGKTLTPAKIEQWQRAHRVPPSAPADASAGKHLAAGLRLAAKDMGRLVLTSPYVQPAMICGVCIGICVTLVRRIESIGDIGLWLCWSLWIVGVWWLVTHRIDRFWLPLTGLWAAVAAVSLCWLREHKLSSLAYAIVLLGLVYGDLMNSSSLISDNRFFVALAALKDDATTDELVGRLPAEQAWMNEHLAADQTRVLLVGEARVFEYRMPVLYSTCFDANPGETLLRGKSPAEQTAALHQHAITHILINWREIDRYRSPGNYGFSDWPQPSDIQQMIADGVITPVDWPLRDGSVELLKVE